MDAGAKATKEEGEVEVGEVVVEEEDSAFLYGWIEMKQEGEEEGWTGGVEEEMEGEGQMWEVEVVGMEVEVVGTEAVVVVEELMEDQG